MTLKSELAQAIAVDTTDVALKVKDTVLSGGNCQLMTVSNYEDTLNPTNNIYSNVVLNATNSTLNGDIVVADPGNTKVINLTSGSVRNGTVNNATSLAQDSRSHWNITSNSIVGQLNNNRTVVFSASNKFDILTVTGNYTGNSGTLIMNSVLGIDDLSTKMCRREPLTLPSIILAVMAHILLRE